MGASLATSATPKTPATAMCRTQSMGHMTRGSLPRVVCSPTAAASSGTQSLRDIMWLEPPTTIADFYDFGAILGQGGFGTVSEILHAKTFQPFAGKAVEKETDLDVEHQFRRVMKTLLNNFHPNVVRMLHLFEDNCNYYVVMDVCQGGDLYHFIKRAFKERKDDLAGDGVGGGIAAFAHSGVQLAVLDDFLGQTVFGIAFLHSLGLLHRDIKPSNLMIQNEDLADLSPTTALVSQRLSSASGVRVCLVDFDMCRFVDEKGEVLGAPIVLEGTIGYLAPEALRGRQYSAKTDVFALGAVAFFLLLSEEPCAELVGDEQSSVLLESLDHWFEKVQSLSKDAITSEADASAREAEAYNGTDPSSPTKSPSRRRAQITAGTNSPEDAAFGPCLSLANQSTNNRPSSAASNGPVFSASKSERPCHGPVFGSTKSMPGRSEGNTSSLVNTGSLILESLSRRGAWAAEPVDSPLTRLWRLVVACVELDPNKRLASATAILDSGLLRSIDANPLRGGACSPTSLASAAGRHRTPSVGSPASPASPTSGSGTSPASPASGSGAMTEPLSPTVRPERSRRRHNTLGTTSISDLLKLGGVQRPLS